MEPRRVSLFPSLAGLPLESDGYSVEYGSRRDHISRVHKRLPADIALARARVRERR